MENKDSDNIAPSETLFSDTKTEYCTNVTSLLENIYYPSESDEAIEWISFQVPTTSSMTVVALAAYLGFENEKMIEEISTDAFWLPIITVEDWYEEEERLQVQKYLEIKALLENHLQFLQAFRIGEVEIELFLIGQMDENCWGGLKTRIIET